MPVERQREYETIYVLRPDSNDDERDTVRNRLESIVEDHQGHVLKVDDWGQRDLAYEVIDDTDGTRYDRGVYFYHRYISPKDTVAEVERNLRLQDVVLKYLSVKLDDNLIAEERLARPQEEDQQILPSDGEEE